MRLKFIFPAMALALLFLLATAFSPDRPAKKSLRAYSNESLLFWNTAAYESMGGNKYQHSLMASRVNAMTHLAIHDALNAIEPLYQTYAFKGRDKKADPEAAVAAAAHTVLLACFPNEKAALDVRLQQALAALPDGNRKQRGVELGRKAAQSILDLRKDDGAAIDPIGKLEPSTVPGVYQAVPPFDFVFAPHWRTMKPFSLQSSSQFRVGAHPQLNSEAYAKALNEVKIKGAKNSTARTAEQTGYAQFWYEFSEIGWNRVARVVAEQKKLSMPETARLLALVNMALADAYTAGWDSKFHYNFWRPYTAIHQAGTDNNPLTSEDNTWEPLLPTPPVHDYPSTHSALGNAGAAVLAAILGDNTPFTMTSNTAVPAGNTRSFASFSQAANENADSRVQAGIHFRFACEAGQELGAKIGQWTVNNYLKPIRK